jgi:DNA polymerase III subunit delta'
VPFDLIEGQTAAIGTLARILKTGQVHHALRFEGPDGVGKEMAAFAFAQALVCTGGDPLGCGHCSACTRAVSLCDGPPAVPMHPDVILVERGLYPPETLGRSRPELQDISVDQVRKVILERAPYPPHEGRARVYIVRRAEELSTSAANAMLKTLEEPGDGTYFVLLTARPARLIDTVRSRSFRIRFGPLADSILIEILKKHGADEQQARDVASLASGSASLAQALIDGESSQRRQAFVDAALKAIGAPELTSALELAEVKGSDKKQLRENLEALAARLARAARSDALKQGPRARSMATRYQIVLRAIREMDRNASSALLVENMMLRLRAITG